MLKSKETLVSYLDRQCDRIILDKDKIKDICKYANEKYDIPKGIINDFLTKRADLNSANIFVLFIITDTFNSSEVLNKRDTKNVTDFFTEQEVKYYKSSKYVVDDIKFPLVFKMVNISEDQWIGNIDISTLMKLRNKQLINYNVNAQRTMRRVVQGDKETYKIYLNQNAVKKIQESFENNNFIPNTITLNIPVDGDNDFYYNEASSELIIKSIDNFHILDGYHRYIAASQIYDLNEDFNYQMELRIVNWDDAKSQTFIFQEDQKTKMKKIDSNSMNMNSPANIVTKRLNDNVMCNLKGLISRNDGHISFGQLSGLIDYFYFKGVSKTSERSIIVKAVKELTDNFNMLTEYDTDYLDNKINYSTLLSAMFCFNYYNGKEIKNMCEVIKNVADIIENSDNKKFKNKTPRKSLMTEIEKIVEKECLRCSMKS